MEAREKKKQMEIKTINKSSDGFWFHTDQGEGPLQGVQGPISVTPGVLLQSHVLVLTSLAGDSGSPLGRAHSWHQELSPGLNQNLNQLKADKSKNKLRNKH